MPLLSASEAVPRPGSESAARMQWSASHSLPPPTNSAVPTFLRGCRNKAYIRAHGSKPHPRVRGRRRTARPDSHALTLRRESSTERRILVRLPRACSNFLATAKFMLTCDSHRFRRCCLLPSPTTPLRAPSPRRVNWSIAAASEGPSLKVIRKARNHAVRFPQSSPPADTGTYSRGRE